MKFQRLRKQDGSLYRCSVRPRDIDSGTNVAPVYELQRDGNDRHNLVTYSLRNATPHFEVDHSEIHILTSDAPEEANNEPLLKRTTTRGRDERTHSLVISEEEYQETRERWLSIIGRLIAAVMFGKLDNNDRERPFVLADFPSNTTFYAVVKDRPHKPGEKPPVDVYLRIQSGRVFASPYEFARHAMWLMDGMPKVGRYTACLCKYCHREVTNRRTTQSRVADQKPISRDLYKLAGWPLPRRLM